MHTGGLKLLGAGRYILGMNSYLWLEVKGTKSYRIFEKLIDKKNNIPSKQNDEKNLIDLRKKMKCRSVSGTLLTLKDKSLEDLGKT